MKNFIPKISLLVTAVALLFSSDALMAQSIGKPGGNLINFFNTSGFGGLLGHRQAGAFGGLGANDQWIGIGQAPIPNAPYGHRIQWGGALATMALQNGNGVNKNLEIQWGGTNATSDMDFNFVFNPLDPNGQRNVMRLTDIGRVGIGTQNPSGKLDVRTATTDNNFYGIYSFNGRSSGAGAYLRGSRYGAYNYAFSTQGISPAYGSFNNGFKNQEGDSYGAYGRAYASDGSAYGLYGVGQACGGAAYGVYGTTNPFFNCDKKTPRYAGYFDGNVVITGTLTVLSDRKLKKNIENEASALEKVMQLRPTTYEYDQEKYAYMDMADGLNHGFIAQELEEVFPEMVTENVHPIVERTYNDEEGKEGEYTEKKIGELDYKGVNYQMMIPVLTKAIQEQQEQIATEKVRNDLLETELADIKRQLAALTNANPNGKGASGTSSINDLETNVLFQNVPNPFDAETVINYTTTTSARTIALNVYNLEGREIARFENLKAGEGSVNISGSTLEAGMYIYTLIVDGQEAGTKRMILTKN